MTYYKAFIQTEDGNFRCKPSNTEFTYLIGNVYDHNDKIEIGKKGFKFYRLPNKDCYKGYDIKKYNLVICKIQPLGKLLWEGDEKVYSDKIKILHVLTKEEIENCSTSHIETHFDQEIIFKDGSPQGKYFYIDAFGSQCWCKDGEFHRDEKNPDNDLTLPAVIHKNGIQVWYKDGKKHRDDKKDGLTLPAVIDDYLEIKIWYKNDLRHRDDKDPDTNLTLPALISKFEQEWWMNGYLHIVDKDPVTDYTLPAVIRGDVKKWYKNGIIHRDDKDKKTGVILPAKIYYDGSSEWYNEGVEFDGVQSTLPDKIKSHLFK